MKQQQEKSRSPFAKAIRNFFKSGVATAGAVILTLVVLMAIFADVLAPFDPNGINIVDRLSPPFSEKNGVYHVLGTDALGRDILSRIIYGSRISLLIGVCAVCVGALVGVTFGLLSGFKGGAWDNVIMRITDVLLAIPFLILALAVIAILGNGLVNVVMVIGLTSWMLYARTVRAEVMSIKNQDFVLMAKAMGVSETKIMLRHILPNVSSSIIVISSLQVARVILFEASLSFLGLGVPPDITTWGSMISDGRNYLNNAWWIATIPGLAIFFTVIGINLVGNRIRDLLDPKLKANE